jgi:hypothetical protein
VLFLNGCEVFERRSNTPSFVVARNLNDAALQRFRPSESTGRCR